MSRIRFYQVISGVLLLLNGVLLFTLFQGVRPARPRFEGPRNEIIERLHFTPEQEVKYDALIRKHQQGIREQEALLIQKKNELYADLNRKDNDSIIEDLAQIQRNIEQIHLQHFREIEQVCTPEQKVYFKALQKEIAQLFARRMKPKRP